MKKFNSSSVGWLMACAIVFSLAPACSSSQEVANLPIENQQQVERIRAALDSVPENELTRFILTVEPRSGEKAVLQQAAHAVVDTLRASGVKADWLENSPVVFVTCTKAELYDALETGYVSSVQVDSVKSPFSPVGK